MSNKKIDKFNSRFLVVMIIVILMLIFIPQGEDMPVNNYLSFEEN